MSAGVYRAPNEVPYGHRLSHGAVALNEAHRHRGGYFPGYVHRLTSLGCHMGEVPEKLKGIAVRLPNK